MRGEMRDEREDDRCQGQRDGCPHWPFLRGTELPPDSQDRGREGRNG